MSKSRWAVVLICCVAGCESNEPGSVHRDDASSRSDARDLGGVSATGGSSSLQGSGGTAAGSGGATVGSGGASATGGAAGADAGTIGTGGNVGDGRKQPCHGRKHGRHGWCEGHRWHIQHGGQQIHRRRDECRRHHGHGGLDGNRRSQGHRRQHRLLCGAGSADRHAGARR